MASMQFRYDGLRRPEPKNMCFFAPRYRRNYAPPHPADAPREEEGQEIAAPKEQQTDPAGEAEQAKQVEPQPSQAEQQVQQAEEITPQALQGAQEAEQVKQTEQLLPQEAFTQTKAQYAKEKKDYQQGQQANQKQAPMMVSDILIENLAQTEGQIVRVKEQIDFARIVLDEFLFKMESILQILEIVRANDTKSASLTTAKAASYKSSKDSIDELLELFQGPVFQKFLRQIFIQVFVPESSGTNFARQT